MKTIHALLVGINQYEHPDIPTLGACVNDAERFAAYLKANVKPGLLNLASPLTDAQATKDNIVTGLREHFRDAKEGETILFYYSGHGCLEKVHPALAPFEKGPTMEALVCHDSMKSSTPLADKELRFLLHEIARKRKARIIVITDSCHSGGATRSVAEGAQRRLSKEAPARQWEQFVFGKQIEADQLENVSDLNELLPQARHIHLAACESWQSAWEVRSGGVFTSGMLDVLENSNGEVSFHDLHSRTRYICRQRFDQSPELYIVDPGVAEAAAAVDQERFTSFLAGAATGRQTSAIVHWDDREFGWVMDRGAIHGIPQKSKAKELDIAILEEKNAKALGSAAISSVKPSDCIIKPASGLTLDKGKTYRAEVKGLYLQPLNVFLQGEAEGVELVQQSLKDQPELFSERNIKIVDDLSQADYQLLADERGFIIARCWDEVAPESALPVCEQVDGHDKEALKKIAASLGKIAHWHFVRRLQNPNPNPGWDLANAVSWELFYQTGYAYPQPGSFRFEMDSEKQADLDHLADRATGGESALPDLLKIDMPEDKKDGGIPIVNLKVRIRRQATHDKKLYVGFLHLSQLYGVTKKLESDTEMLENEGDTVWGFTQKGVPFKLDDYITDFGWPDESITLKLFISTEPFSLSTLLQDQLKPPKKSRSKGEMTRGELGGFNSGTPDLPDWLTKMVEVRLVNPA